MGSRKRLLCLTAEGATVIALALVAPALAWGGGTTYSTTTQTGQSIVPGTVDIGNHCDDCTTLVALPFPVPVYDAFVTSAYVSSNGNIQFNTDNGGWATGCQELPINGLDLALIPYLDDLRTDEAGGGIFTEVIGSPPNRQFVIEWRASYFQRSGAANFEVVFTEGSGTLSVIYGATADSGAQETSGIQAADLGPSTQFSCGEATLVNGLRVNYVPSGSPPPPPPPPPSPPPPPVPPPPPPPLPPPPPPPLPPPPPPPPPPAPARCRVPRVIGLRLAVARTRIRRARCSVGRVRRARSRRVGRVIGQNPRAGSVKRRGFPVRLVVGRR